MTARAARAWGNTDGYEPPRGPTKEVFCIAGSGGGDSWDWTNSWECSRIIRYRIRKPRGLTLLENLIADLPAPVGKVDA
jgi:hypothetical protein